MNTNPTHVLHQLAHYTNIRTTSTHAPLQPRTVQTHTLHKLAHHTNSRTSQIRTALRPILRTNGISYGISRPPTIQIPEVDIEFISTNTYILNRHLHAHLHADCLELSWRDNAIFVDVEQRELSSVSEQRFVTLSRHLRIRL